MNKLHTNEARAWLEALGIDTRRARRVEIVFEVGAPVTICVDQFADERVVRLPPPDELLDAPITYRTTPQ